MSNVAHCFKRFEGGIGPIGVGQILQRSSSEKVTRQLIRKYRNKTLSEQIGIGAKSCCEFAIHTTREIIQKYQQTD